MIFVITFVCCLGTLLFGMSIGFSVRTRRIEEKKREVLKLMSEVRAKNNEMLMNFSKVAHAATQTEGSWTEVDDFLMPMWME